MKAWRWLASAAVAVISAWFLLAPRLDDDRSPRGSEAAATARPAEAPARDAISLRSGAGGDPQRNVSPSPEHQPVSWNAQVVDRNGAPVARATVVVLDANGREIAQAPVDVEGAARLDVAPEQARRIRARAEGYRDATVDPPEADSEVVRITLARLDRGGAIRGSVRWQNGEPAGSALVAIWPTGYPPQPEDLAVRGAPTKDEFEATSSDRVLVVEVRDDGSFAAQGLDLRGRYTATAMVEGGICPKRRTGVSPGDEPIELVLATAYGAVVHLREPGGAPLRTGPGVYGRGMFWEHDIEGVKSVHGLRAEVPFAGPSLIADMATDSRDDELLLFTAPGSAPVIGPITFSADIPGYGEVETELFAQRADLGLADHVVELQPTASGWCDVTVLCLGGGMEGLAAVDWTESRPLGVLRLRDASGRHLEAAVRPPLTPVRGVPWGSYEARFVAGTAFLYPPSNHEPLHLELAPGCSGLEVPLRFENTAAARFLVNDEAGAPYRGRLMLEFRERDQVFYKSFAGAPYLVPAILPGEYEVRVRSLATRDAVSPPVLQLPVVSDEIAIGRFALSR